MDSQLIEELIEAIKRASRVGLHGPEYVTEVELIETEKRGAKWGLLVRLGSECPLGVLGRIYIALAETVPKGSPEFLLSDVLVEDGAMTLQVLGGCQIQ